MEKILEQNWREWRTAMELPRGIVYQAGAEAQKLPVLLEDQQGGQQVWAE